MVYIIAYIFGFLAVFLTFSISFSDGRSRNSIVFAILAGSIWPFYAVIILILGALFVKWTFIDERHFDRSAERK